MPDIFLYAGEATPNDVRLGDPTVVRPSGTTLRTLMMMGIGCWILAMLVTLWP